MVRNPNTAFVVLNKYLLEKLNPHCCQIKVLNKCEFVNKFLEFIQTMQSLSGGGFQESIDICCRQPGRAFSFWSLHGRIGVKTAHAKGQQASAYAVATGGDARW